MSLTEAKRSPRKCGPAYFDVLVNHSIEPTTTRPPNKVFVHPLRTELPAMDNAKRAATRLPPYLLRDDTRLALYESNCLNWVTSFIRRPLPCQPSVGPIKAATCPHPNAGLARKNNRAVDCVRFLNTTSFRHSLSIRHRKRLREKLAGPR